MKKPAYIWTQLKNAPDFSEFGFFPSVTLTGWAFFKMQNGLYIDNEIDMATVRRNADLDWWDGKEQSPIIFDVETLPVVTSDRPRRDHVHDQLIEVCQLYRNHSRHHHKAIGFYAMPPMRDMWRAIGELGEEKRQQWLSENQMFFSGLDDNDLSTSRGVVDCVDRIYPGLYYWYPQHFPERFQKYVDANLEAAAQYKKPIIPFVSPNIQQSGYPFWEPGIWQEMLGYIYNHPLVDGVHLWVIANEQTEWDFDANWWQETKDVLGQS